MIIGGLDVVLNGDRPDPAGKARPGLELVGQIGAKLLRPEPLAKFLGTQEAGAKVGF